MQAAEQTEEKMNELKIIQMRGILDSKTFYKRTENRPGVLPKFFQVCDVFIDFIEYSLKLFFI